MEDAEVRRTSAGGNQPPMEVTKYRKDVDEDIAPNTKKRKEVPPIEEIMYAEDFDPFQRRDSIPRSPGKTRSEADFKPQGESSTDGQSSHEAISTNKRDVREQKRKRVETPEKERTVDEESSLFIKKMEKEANMLKELLRKTMDEIGILQKTIVEIPNTKKEIKLAINKLASYSKRMPGATEFITEIMEELKEVKVMEEVAEKKTVEVQTQTPTEKQKTTEAQIERIENYLKKEIDVNELQSLLELSWPEEVYQSCEVCDEIPARDDQDLIIIMDTNEDRNDPVINKVLQSNPFFLVPVRFP